MYEKEIAEINKKIDELTSLRDRIVRVKEEFDRLVGGVTPVERNEERVVVPAKTETEDITPAFVPAKKFKEKLCDTCGKPFVPNGPSQITCQNIECKRKKAADATKRWMEKKAQKVSPRKA